jgi:glycosyltransferase involved in cell wall biosynthesis
MLFTLAHSGHYSSFVRFLVDGWRGADGELVVVLSANGAAKQPDRRGVRILAVGDDELASVKSATRRDTETTLAEVLSGRLSPAAAAARHWEVLRRYAERLEPAHALVVSLESVWGAVAAGLDLPCRFSGILAAPPQAPQHGDSPRARAGRLHERFVVERVLAHPRLDTLFYNYAPPFHGVGRGADKLRQFSTPVRRSAVDDAARAALRDRLGIERERQVCLLFGELSLRKGPLELVAAASRLPNELASQLTLAVVGRLKGADRQPVEEALMRLAADTPVQVVRQLEWFPEDDVPALFAVADVVAAPYVEDYGVSAVVALAAAAERPVLATERGTVGATVREYGLGLVADPTRPWELAAALERLLRDPGLADRGGMRRLVAGSSPERFARTVYDRLPIGAAR